MLETDLRVWMRDEALRDEEGRSLCRVEIELSQTQELKVYDLRKLLPIRLLPQ